MRLVMVILRYIASSFLVVLEAQMFIKLEDCKTSLMINFCGPSSSFHKEREAYLLFRMKALFLKDEAS